MWLLVAVLAPGLTFALGSVLAWRHGRAVGRLDGIGAAVALAHRVAHSRGPVVVAEAVTYPACSVRMPPMREPPAGVATLPDGRRLEVPYAGSRAGVAPHPTQVAVFARTMLGAPPLAPWADC